MYFCSLVWIEKKRTSGFEIYICVYINFLPGFQNSTLAAHLVKIFWLHCWELSFVFYLYFTIHGQNISS